MYMRYIVDNCKCMLHFGSKAALN